MKVLLLQKVFYLQKVLNYFISVFDKNVVTSLDSFNVFDELFQFGKSYYSTTIHSDLHLFYVRVDFFENVFVGFFIN